METVASFYPSLHQRKPLPLLYIPTGFLLAILTFVNTSYTSYTSRWTAVITLPLLLGLTIARPCFTAGDATTDYNTSTLFFGWALQVLDFAVFCPVAGEKVLYRGTIGLDPNGRYESAEGKVPTFWRQVKFAIRLQLTPSRGIGFNWQVKGVPGNEYARLSKGQYVRMLAWRVVRHFLQKEITLVILGAVLHVEVVTGSNTLQRVCHVLVGWCGACWTWHALQSTYFLGAFVTVLLGVCEPWEWPPIVGSLSDAWSVRQMWSSTYHQMIRRLVQQPGVRLARFMRFAKGSKSSSYLQLYLAFGISMLLHENNIFNVTRSDGGEFAFFMSQPFVITLEDFIIWLLRSDRQSVAQRPRQRWNRLVGYCWVLLWFSCCLPTFVKGLLGAGVIASAQHELRAVEIGRWYAAAVLRYSSS